MLFETNCAGIGRLASKNSAAWCALLAFLSAASARAQVGHVHQLHYSNSWVDTDLTALTNGGTPSTYGAIAAVYTTPNYQRHVYYVDGNTDHVHQTYFNGSNWTDEDLSAETTGLRASPYGIAAFTIGNFQYVYYVDLDAHDVHQLTYNNSNWTDQNLTLLAGSVHAGLGPMLAFATTPNNQFHVYYQDGTSNLDLHQLYFNGTSWSDSDLTQLTGGLCYTSWLSGFAVQNVQHVFCPGYTNTSTNLDMIHVFYNNATWIAEDVTQKAGVPLPQSLGSFVSSFPLPNANRTAVSLQVYGITSDFHVHQFTKSTNGWSNLDLTSASGAPTDGAYGGSVAFRTTPNNQFHIYYAPNMDVDQLYYNGASWSAEDLNNGGGNASNNGGVAGFSLGNQQFVYYISH